MTDRNDAYAAALLEIAKAEGNLDTVEDELFRVARTIESNEALRSTLTDQAIPVDRRQRIVEALLDGKASPVTTALVSFVVGAGRSRNLPEIIDRLVARAAEERREAVAEVRTAYPLDEDHRQKLADALGKDNAHQASPPRLVHPPPACLPAAPIRGPLINRTARPKPAPPGRQA